MAAIPPPVPIVEEIKVIEEVIEEVVKEIKCSCIRGIRRKGIELPRPTNAWDIEPNSTPKEGGLALFTYDPNDYTKDHAGYIGSLKESGFWMYDENFNNPIGGCRSGWRFVLWDDENLKGFWFSTKYDTL